MKINWSEKLNEKGFSGCHISVDGTDRKIFKPTLFSGKWLFHKIFSTGLRYEIGVSTEKGRLVWVNGPYPCGLLPDVRISRERT